MLYKWFNESKDVRFDISIQRNILARIGEHGVRSVVMTDGIIGCSHEEGIDYPVGEPCPRCPYWAGRNRFDPEKTEREAGARIMLGVAWYRRDDYPRMREICEDREGMAATYDEWLEGLDKLRELHESENLHLVRVDIDSETFAAWCAEKGCRLDGEARVLFVGDKVRRDEILGDL